MFSIQIFLSSVTGVSKSHNNDLMFSIGLLDTTTFEHRNNQTQQIAWSEQNEQSRDSKKFGTLHYLYLEVENIDIGMRPC